MSKSRLFVYFLVFILGFGALGVWIPIVEILLQVPNIKVDEVVSNLATLVISMALLAYADSQLARNPQNEDDRTPKLILFAIMLLAGTGGVCALVIKKIPLALIIACAGAVFAVVEWFWVNLKNPNFQTVDATAPLGGTIPK
jgi:hypothetical protein